MQKLHYAMSSSRRSSGPGRVRLPAIGEGILSSSRLQPGKRRISADFMRFQRTALRFFHWRDQPASRNAFHGLLASGLQKAVAQKRAVVSPYWLPGKPAGRRRPGTQHLPQESHLSAVVTTV